jgi:hypothetical protein
VPQTAPENSGSTIKNRTGIPPHFEQGNVRAWTGVISILKSVIAVPLFVADRIDMILKPPLDQQKGDSPMKTTVSVLLLLVLAAPGVGAQSGDKPASTTEKEAAEIVEGLNLCNQFNDLAKHLPQHREPPETLKKEEQEFVDWFLSGTNADDWGRIGGRCSGTLVKLVFDKSQSAEVRLNNWEQLFVVMMQLKYAGDDFHSVLQDGLSTAIEVQARQMRELTDKYNKLLAYLLGYEDAVARSQAPITLPPAPAVRPSPITCISHTYPWGTTTIDCN